MFVRHLALVDFRSWSQADLPLTPGPTVLVGHNGAGKTNLLEAIGYLATLGSHRVAADAALIRCGRERAHVAAAVVSAGRELTIDVEIAAGAANKARINKAPQRRARDILGLVRSVLFAPEDLALVRGDPADRRRFLDTLLVMRAPRLAGVKADYDKILRQRSTLLKSAGAARRAGAGLATLDVWDEHLAAAGAELLAARLRLVDELRPHLAAAYRAIAPATEDVDMRYRTALFGDAARADAGKADWGGAGPVRADRDRDGASGRGGGGETGGGETGDAGADGTIDPSVRGKADLAAAMRAAMVRLRGRELDRGVCLVGPHRDELDLLLHGGIAKGYASHGESWSMALALRLASFELLRADGVDPILLLDDVFAELDTARRETLMRLAYGAEQAIITAAVAGDVPADFAGTTVTVSDGAITRVES